MNRVVHCVRLNQEAEGLDYVPYPGDLGQRIFDHVSKAAWHEWLRVQTMLINENRLNPLDPDARQYIEQQMEAFFFDHPDKPTLQ